MILVQGLARSFDLSSNGVPVNARHDHLAWLLCFCPKLLALTTKLNEHEKFLVAEDSCCPTRSASPDRVFAAVKTSDNLCLWMGYCNEQYPPPQCTVSQEINADGQIVDLPSKKMICAPYGLKWVVLDKHLIRLLYRAFCQLSLSTCAEHYFKMLVASGHLKVIPPMAGSDEHFSLVDGRTQQVLSLIHI